MTMRQIVTIARRYKSTSRNLLRLTERHGFIANYWPREKGHDIAAFLEKESRTIYAGFDPTAQSLHVGNLLVIMGLLQAQRNGHQAIALIGGATARIGDPSGKSEERPSLAAKSLHQNISGLEKNLKTIFAKFKEVHPNIEDLKIVNNAEWYENINTIDFTANVLKHCRVAKMLAKDSVKTRLDVKKGDPEGGISGAEFLYQAYQAYDWLHLSREHDCLLQLGGHDQIGNISAGHELIRRVDGKEAYGLVLPLMTTESGQKLGKSEGNAVWLSPSLTSSFDFYQYFVRIPDSEVEKMLYFFTFLPPSEIQDVIKLQKQRPEKREAQLKLASEVTKLVHGQKGLDLAFKTTEILYNKNQGQVLDTLRSISKDELKSIFQSAAYVKMIMQPGMTILQFAMKLQCFKNEKIAQDIIQSGGFSVNQIKRTNIDQVILPGEHILQNQLSLVKIGKKNYVIVDWDV